MSRTWSRLNRLGTDTYKQLWGQFQWEWQCRVYWIINCKLGNSVIWCPGFSLYEFVDNVQGTLPWATRESSNSLNLIYRRLTTGQEGESFIKSWVIIADLLTSRGPRQVCLLLIFTFKLKSPAQQWAPSPSCRWSSSYNDTPATSSSRSTSPAPSSWSCPGWASGSTGRPRQTAWPWVGESRPPSLHWHDPVKVWRPSSLSLPSLWTAGPTCPR